MSVTGNVFVCCSG